MATNFRMVPNGITTTELLAMLPPDGAAPAKHATLLVMCWTIDQQGRPTCHWECAPAETATDRRRSLS